MKKLSILFLLLVNSIIAQTNIEYQISNEIIFNPERGFSKFTETNPEPNYTQLSLSTLNGYKNGVDKISVIYRGFYLPSTETIPQSYIDKMQIDFDRLRQSGLKVIVRFAYTRSTSCTTCQPTKSIILSHITQLANVINTNKDVIVTVQAGFIGAYGEYYYTNSSEFGDENYLNYTQTQWNNRKEIFDSMLLNFDESIPLQLRYPYAKTTMYGQSYIPRIGFFNDAFLNTYGDEGFFPIGQNANPTQQQINQVITQTVNEPMIGETNGVSDRTNGANALVEMDLYNWSIINKDYYIPVITSWQNDGTYTTINKRLGYRFSLKHSTFSFEDDILNVSIDIRNDGFTTPFKKRKVYLLLNDYQFEIDTNIKEWSSTTLTSQIDTSNLPVGVYNAYLWIPDEENQNRAEYSIQLANVGTWINGKNNLLYSFEKTNLGIKHNEIQGVYYQGNKVMLPFETEYELFSVLGQRIEKKTAKEIDLETLQKTVYIVKFKEYKPIKVIKK